MNLAKENQKLASQLNGTLKNLKEKERGFTHIRLSESLCFL